MASMIKLKEIPFTPDLTDGGSVYHQALFFSKKKNFLT